MIIRDRVRMRESTSPTPSRLHSLYPTSFLQKDEEEKVTTLLGALKAKRPPKEQARDAINHYIPGARGVFFRRLNCLLNTVMSANTFRLEMCYCSYIGCITSRKALANVTVLSKQFKRRKMLFSRRECRDLWRLELVPPSAKEEEGRPHDKIRELQSVGHLLS